MKVTIDHCDADPDFEPPDSLGVYLDNGTEVGRFCIVENAEREKSSLEKTLQAIWDEGEKHGEGRL